MTEDTMGEHLFTIKEGEREMNVESGIVFSGRASAGRTTYFVDVRQAVNFRYYISITESRRVSDSGFEQNRIFIFEENLEDVGDLLGKAVSELKRVREERGPLPEGDTPGKYERNGKAWTKEEEDLLRKEFNKNTDRDRIAGKLKRSAYAVTLRLEKLGLVEKPEESPVSAGNT
jgi:hypothetical protein